jgi:hypothetical protein
MNNIDIKRICVHECCHAIVARLFRQRLAIGELEVSKHLVKQGQDQGALNVIGPSLNDEEDFTALAITLLAGVVGDNMYLQDRNAIRAKSEEIIANNAIMDWRFAGGDLYMFSNTALVFSIEYQIDQNKFKGFCLRFLIDFLSKDEVWYMIEKLCDKLLKKDDLKLSENELKSIFGQNGLDTILDSKREEYLKQVTGVLQFCQSSE